MSSYILQPYDWHFEDNNDEIYTCRIWCHNENSERVLLRIEDYNPGCYIEMPIIIDNRVIVWSDEMLTLFVNFLYKALGKNKPISVIPEFKEKLQGFREHRKTLFLNCRFRSSEAKKHCTNYINKESRNIYGLGNVKCTVHETSIDDMHRMITDMKITYGGWFSIEASPVESYDKLSNNPIELIGKSNTAKLLPDFDLVSKPKLCAFDIESYSQYADTYPNPWFIENTTYMISYISQVHESPETRKIYLLVLGKLENFDNVEVRSFPDELSLYTGFFNLIMEDSPTLIIGYNIYRSDIKYIMERYKHYLRDNPDNINILKYEETYVRFTEFYSAAYGHVHIRKFNCEGRLTLDLYPLVKRSFGRERSYKLSAIADKFLKGSKGKITLSATAKPKVVDDEEQEDDIVAETGNVTIKETFRRFKAYRDAIMSGDNLAISKTSKDMYDVARYCIQDSILCVELMTPLNIWICLIETSSNCQITAFQTFSRGQQIGISHQLYTQCQLDNKIMNRSTCSSDGFKGAVVLDPIPGKYVNLIQYDFKSLYPSIIKAKNICYSTYLEDDSPIDDKDCNIIEGEENGIPFRYRFIKEEIYRGILPRMCDYFLTERAKVRKQIGPQNTDTKNAVLNERQSSLKVNANSIYGSLGLGYEGDSRLIPGSRSVTSVGRNMLSTLITNIKGSGGNVVYGDTDSSHADYGITDPRECILQGPKLAKELSKIYGSKHIELACEGAVSSAIYICPKRYIYISIATIQLSKIILLEESEFIPDWDNGKNVLLHIKYKEGNKIIETYLTFPKELDYTDGGQYNMKGQYCEKEKMPNSKYGFISGRPVLEGGQPNEEKVTFKGVMAARRDNCKWGVEIYRKIMFSSLFERPLKDTLKIVDDAIDSMLARKVILDNMCFSTNINAGYSEKSHCPVKTFVDELIKRGKKVEAGNRIDYVLVKCNNVKLLGESMRLLEEYEENKSVEQLDLTSYIKKSMEKQLSQLIYIGYKTEMDHIVELPCKRGKIFPGRIDKKYIATKVKFLTLRDAVLLNIKSNKESIEHIRLNQCVESIKNLNIRLTAKRLNYNFVEVN